MRSWFSFLSGGSSPTELAAQARALGMSALALTDVNGVYGLVRFQQACRRFGLHAVVGAEVRVDGHPLVLLCRSRAGYANLCRLLTQAHLRQPQSPACSLGDLAAHRDDLICLTGGREGLLWQQVEGRQCRRAEAWLSSLRELFGPDLYIELCHGLLPGDGAQVDRLHRLAQRLGLAVLATNDVRFAIPGHHRRYDLLTCIRLGIRVADPHPQRPRNAEAWLKSELDLRRLIPFPEAFASAAAVAAACHVDLVPEHLTPPAAHLPEGQTARSYLARLCGRGLAWRYPPDRLPAARSQMQRELAVIGQLELEEFFLVVHEVVGEARRRGIRCAGRGSAANSIVAYLLGITAVDPLRHHLLFERFLHGGRKGTPDIDVDFDSDRRREVIAWMEERFGLEQTAMTATLVTYQLRLALRDVARALGWPPAVTDRLTESVPPGEVGQALRHRARIEEVLGRSPLVDLLVELTVGLEGCPRHLGLHVGGMVLSRRPLHHFSPVQVSANGVKMVQFDKLDVEALGLVKLDVLGLRMLAALSEAVELVERHEGLQLDLEALPLDDEGAFELIRSGKTLALFQIESMGQMHLIARNPPRTFDDLVVQIALFRPGPLQGNMVHPYLRRRKGEEPPQFDHPDLEPILRDTFGIILFQEQVLEIAHRFAGLSLEEADDFRALMTRFREPGRMEAMRRRFVSGAAGRGVPRATADRVFEQVSRFVGYGFCRSHAAAFAQTVYHSAWMKRYHPAAYLAAFMQHRPGMYNLMTLEEEARRCAVPVRPPRINVSGVRYDLERLPDGRLAIRKPLSAILGISEETARQIAWCRMAGPFASVEDLCERVSLGQDILDALARCGALDDLAGSSRKALWEVGVLARRSPPVPRRQTPLFPLRRLSPDPVPDLPELNAAERLSWDYQTHGAARVHPLILARRRLADLGVPPIRSCYHLVPALGDQGPTVTLAGVAILRQRPPTARGFLFLTLEDETGYLQCVVPPRVQERLYPVLVLPAVIARGQLQATGRWRALLLEEAWPLEGIFGGYAGFPSSRGHHDRLATEAEGMERSTTPLPSPEASLEAERATGST